MTISVVICSIDATKFKQVSAMYGRLLAGGPHELIHIPDATGLAEGYNRGLARSRGELVIFSHDDVEFLASDFRARLLGHMKECDVLGVMGTRRLSTASWAFGSGLPYGYGQLAYRNPSSGMFDIVIWSAPTRRVDRIQAMDGMFLCARRDVAAQLKFDQAVFQKFHLYDTDFTFRAHFAGYRCAIANDLYVIHASGGSRDAQLGEDVRRFMELHGAKLAPVLSRHFRAANVAVATPAEVIEVMTPPHWGDGRSTDSKTSLWGRIKQVFGG